MKKIQADSKSEIIFYGIKQFIKYFLFGIIASNIPFLFFGPLIGFPIVIYAALFLAIYEIIHIDLKKSEGLEVFTETTIVFLILTFVLVLFYYFVMFFLLR